MTVLVIVPSVVCLAAVAVLLCALRGRRVDDHPVCRRCGFDLIGKPHGSTACAECGADLSRPRAVGRGNRHRSRLAAAAASALLLASFGWLGVTGWRAARGLDWTPHKPVWWLMRELRSPDAPTRDVARLELLRRVKLGGLSDAQLAALADRALEYQADAGKPWLDTWGETIETAHARGRLPREKWQRYALQATASAITLHARPKLRPGDPVRCHVVLRSPRDGPRVGPAATFFPAVGFPPALEISGRLLPDKPSRGGRLMYDLHERGVSTLRMNALTLDVATVKDLPPGPHRLRVHVPVEIHEGDHGGPALLKTTIPVEATFTLAAANERIMGMLHDPGLRPGVEGSVKARAEGHGSLRVRVVFEASALPVDLGYEVWVLHGGKEWHCGSIALVRGQTSSSDWVYVELRHRQNYRLQLLLRPSVRAALRDLDLAGPIWDEELRLDVTFKRNWLGRGVGVGT